MLRKGASERGLPVRSSAQLEREAVNVVAAQLAVLRPRLHRWHDLLESSALKGAQEEDR